MSVCVFAFVLLLFFCFDWLHQKFKGKKAGEQQGNKEEERREFKGKKRKRKRIKEENKKMNEINFSLFI